MTVPKVELEALAEFARACQVYAGKCSEQNANYSRLLAESDKQLDQLNKELHAEKKKPWFLIPASLILGVVVGKAL